MRVTKEVACLDPLLTVGEVFAEAGQVGHEQGVLLIKAVFFCFGSRVMKAGQSFAKTLCFQHGAGLCFASFCQ